MANEFELSPKELKRQADALLAAADAAEKAAEREPAARSAKKSTRKKGEETAQEAPAVMTDEEARKAGILRLDDKQVAALPAASWLMNNEKLRELLARGKKKGKLDSADLMDAVDDLNLESDQMDQLYDSLEALNIDISADDALLADLPDDEPAAEEIADVEEEELVDPNTLVNSFSIDDPVRMYLKEIGKVPLLSPDEEIDLAQAMGAGNEADRKLAEIDRLRKAQTIPDEELAQLKKQVKAGEKAKQSLAEANLRLVVSIAKRGQVHAVPGSRGQSWPYQGRGEVRLHQGLQVLHLRHMVDPVRPLPAPSHQAHCIPVHMVETINKVIRVSRQLLQELGHDPSPEEISEEMNMPRDKVREILKIAQEPVSLETPIGGEDSPSG